MAPRKYPPKKPTAPQPAPPRKSAPAAPQTEPMGPVEFDRTIERLIRQAEKKSGDDWNHWAEVALHLERARTPLRKVMTDAERRRVQ